MIEHAVVRNPRYVIQGVKAKGEVYEFISDKYFACLPDAEREAERLLSQYVATRVLREEVVMFRTSTVEAV